ncbi:MAG: type II toxin-antitoxin system RelE/ParE family toxin [Candidatus Sulfotelmatobacter sp.]
MTLPVVWTPEANEDLLEARAWYDNIRPELGERFALAVEATVEAIAEHPLQFHVVYRNRSPRGGTAFPVQHVFRVSGASDCGNRLLPRQTQSETLAIAVAVGGSSVPLHLRI